MGNHGEAAAGGTNPGGKSLFQEAPSSQTADARPLSSTPLTKGLSCRIQVFFKMKLFRQSFNIHLYPYLFSRMCLNKKLNYRENNAEYQFGCNDIITQFCPAEGALTALFGMLLGTD